MWTPLKDRCRIFLFYSPLNGSLIDKVICYMKPDPDITAFLSFYHKTKSMNLPFYNNNSNFFREKLVSSQKKTRLSW